MGNVIFILKLKCFLANGFGDMNNREMDKKRLSNNERLFAQTPLNNFHRRNNRDTKVFS